MGICTPALAYIVLSGIAVFLMVQQKASTIKVSFTVFIVLIWAFLINVLCDKEFTSIAWIILFVAFLNLAYQVYEGKPVNPVRMKRLFSPE